MRSYYAVLEIQKLHGMGPLGTLQAHNDREYPMNHIDENLTHLNRDIISTGGSSYRDRFREIIEERELLSGKSITIRKNAVTALSVVTAMSPGAEKALNIDIDKWCEKNKEWFEKTFGAENILVMQLHMDEVDNTASGRRGIHLHTVIVPIDNRDKLCAVSFTGNRTKLKRLQSSYGEAMEEFGLLRGEPNSKIHHEARKRWYHAVEGICTEKAPRINDGENMEDYLNRLDAFVQDKMISAEKEVEHYKRKYELSQTRQAQIFGEYAYAVNLQHILEEQYSGDMTLTNERLKKYQILEKCVPRKNLDMMIDKMIEKYPPENSLNFFRKGKKKKHAKWESIPDTVTDTTSSSANPIMLEDEEIYPEENKQENSNGFEANPAPEDKKDDIFGNVFGETLE